MSGDQFIEKDGLCISEKDRVLAWTKDVAASTASEAPKPTSFAPHPEARRVDKEPARVVVNQFLTTPAVVVTRVKPEPPKDDISTKAIIGTILGATAGAVVAYGTCFRSPILCSCILETFSGSLTLTTCFRLHILSFRLY